METEGQAQTEAGTSQDDAPVPNPMGEATPAPPLFLFFLWLPVFAGIVWGMMLIFGRRPWEFSDPEPLVPEPGPDEAES